MPRAGWVKPVSDRRLSDLVSVGALIAVPAAEAIQLLLQEVVYPQRDNDLAAPAEDQDRCVVGP